MSLGEDKHHAWNKQTSEPQSFMASSRAPCNIGPNCEGHPCRRTTLSGCVARKHSVGLAFDSDSPNFWRCTRQNPRVPATVRVVVRGTDPNPFIHTAYTVDISRTGARLDGVGYLVKPGAAVAVERRWRGRARYRVVWVGQTGTEQVNQVGLVCLDAEKNIWDLKLPEGEAEDSGKGASPSKKGRAPER